MGFGVLTFGFSNTNPIKLDRGSAYHIDSQNFFANVNDVSKLLKFNLGGAAVNTTLTITTSQNATRTLTIPVLTANDTLATLGLAQTFSAALTFSAVATFNGNALFNGSGSPMFNVGAGQISQYKTTNAGGITNPAMAISLNSSLSTGEAWFFDASNLFSFGRSNGTTQILRASIRLANSVDTAGSESSDLAFHTQSGGTALSEKFRITSVGNLQLFNPAGTFQYSIVPAAIAAGRILNLPLLTATDTIATLGLAQTFTGNHIIATSSGIGLTVYNTGGINSALVVGNTANGKTSLIGDYAGSGDIPPGGFFGSNGSGGFTFAPSTDFGNSGAKIAFCFYTGSSWKSALEFSNANISAMYIFKNGGLSTTGGGGVRIGSSSAPTALLHLAAGTAAASTAPLKLTSGTNLTTPENGAFEYNGTNLFFTRAAAVRESIITQSAVTTEALISDTSVTINIAGVTYKLLAKA